MSLWKIVLKNILERKLSATLTVLSIALGVALTISILAVKRESQDRFRQTAFGYELVVGSRGSPTQLVLNTVYHLDVSPGNIPYETYRQLREEDPRVRMAIPIAVGDHYRGFRIVGTSDQFLTKFEVLPGEKFRISGRPFQFCEGALQEILSGKSHEEGHSHDHGDEVFEAVVGSTVSEQAGLKVGSTFVATHGVEEGPAETHEESWKVVGVLAPTGTPADRAIYINLESFFGIEGHSNEGEISAVILKTRGGFAALSLAAELNQRSDVMAVVPAQVVGDLFSIIGTIDQVLLAVSLMVIVVAGISVLVSIYNSMNERRRSIAVMRALGARRRTVWSIIVLESIALCLLGGLVGLFLGHGISAGAAGYLQSEVGVTLSPLSFHREEVFVLAGLLVLGLLAGTIPAWKAYRTDIADGLSVHG